MTKSATIDRICRAISEGNRERAAEVLSSEYPFTSAARGQRRYTEYQMMQVFLRDGFIDRYSGERLVFPGTLRLLSQLMPGEFPAHKNWKMAESHQAFWELFPTIDHIVPVARGGADDQSNWVTTSMLRNSAKAHWTLEELGWRLHAPAPSEEWDGLTGWFLERTEMHPELLASQYLRRWRGVALRARKGV
ncbi:MAG: hypothetical protein IT377_20700 [Polyangiaceae bacterium]|nr:hypothetical protein [Polyangiaceae bacterium]